MRWGLIRQPKGGKEMDLCKTCAAKDVCKYTAAAAELVSASRYFSGNTSIAAEIRIVRCEYRTAFPASQLYFQEHELGFGHRPDLKKYAPAQQQTEKQTPDFLNALHLACAHCGAMTEGRCSVCGAAVCDSCATTSLSDDKVFCVPCWDNKEADKL